AVPALGLVLATVASNTAAGQIVIDRRGVTFGRSGRIAVDERGRVLVGYVAPERLTVVPFLDLWTAVEERRAETLRGLVDDKIVLVLAEPALEQHRTPVGSMSDARVQAELLNAVLTGSWPRRAPLGWTLGGTIDRRRARAPPGRRGAQRRARGGASPGRADAKPTTRPGARAARRRPPTGGARRRRARAAAAAVRGGRNRHA